MNRRDTAHFSGCLLGGAVGDALGAPVEFLSLAQIRQRWGDNGLQDYIDLNNQGKAEFTDDTQMTLFTAEGLVIGMRRGRERGIWSPTEAIYRGYLRWLRTQRLRHSGPTGELTREGWLLGVEGMWKIRAPGSTCLSALSSGKMGSPDTPINDSKGCGGVMRVAPIGLVFPVEMAFEEGAKAAALTHGHPAGYLSAGCLAQMISVIINNNTLPASSQFILEMAYQSAITNLARWPDHAETLHALQKAWDHAHDPLIHPSAEVVESLGSGWVGEEALAIAFYCAFVHADNFAAAVRLAVNHSGDSDSTGAICGNILGALHGAGAIPKTWLDRLDLCEEVEKAAQELLE